MHGNRLRSLHPARLRVPSDMSRNTPLSFDESPRSVRDLVDVVLRHWGIVVASGLIFGFAALAYGVLADRQYRAVTTLLPVERDNANGMLSSIATQLGGLAALAGATGGDADRVEALEVLKSRALARKFIDEHGLVPILYADRWSAETQRWVVAESEVPTLIRAEGQFRSRIVRVSEDLSSGLITIAVTWTNPQQAAEWANGLVRLANDELRTQAITRAQANLDYLERELNKVAILEVRQSIYELMQAQIRTAMVANVGDEFAFKVVDQATPPEQPSSPRVAILLGISIVLGLFVGVLVSFVIPASGQTEG